MPKAKQVKNYEELKKELDLIMEELQREDLDVDMALTHYKRGLELTKEIESYLKNAENKVIELKANFET
jgi:exodeoxyribonuclease VII small subunit